MSCKGCVTLSDIPRDGVQDYDEVVQSIQEWSQVLDPDWIVIFGGEPLMHPQIKDITRQVRKHWPNARISIPTNGLLLRRIMDTEWLAEVQPVEVRVSLHKDDKEGRFFKGLISDFMSMYTGWKPNISPFGESALPPSPTIGFKFNFIHDSGVSVAVSQNEEYIIPYTFDETGRRAPYASDPVKAHKRCVSPELVFIYKNLLWKCIPYPNLRDTEADFAQRWPHYTPYKSTDDLTAFFHNVTKPESICSMCPESGTIMHNDPTTVKILPKSKWIEAQVKAK
jgi:organic radical activating enzyme